jgi:hypothetical protein
MLHVRRACRALAAAMILSIVGALPAGAGEPPVPLWRCKGALHFTDALARAATVFVDLERAQVSTPDCRKYTHLDGYCSGVLLDIADHSFEFGGAVSPENAKFWADLYRPSRVLPPAGPLTEAMRVLFLGRCEPIVARRAAHLK